MTGVRPPAIRSADVALSALTAGPRFNATLMGIFGAAALVIGGGAAYAVASLSAIQRRRELAVRAALGASLRQLVLPIIRQAIRCLVVGLLIGLPAGWAIASVFDAHLFLVTSGDVEIYGAVAVVMLGSTMVAVAGPAWRAARANPATELSRE